MVVWFTRYGKLIRDFLGLCAISSPFSFFCFFFSIGNNTSTTYIRAKNFVCREILFPVVHCDPNAKSCRRFLAPHPYFRFSQRDALCTCIQDFSPRYGFTVTSRRNEGCQTMYPVLYVPRFFYPWIFCVPPRFPIHPFMFVWIVFTLLSSHYIGYKNFYIILYITSK